MNKAPDAFRTISEVADELDLPQHVLRFWESRFPHIKPMKRGGGRRYYRPEDIDLLRGIRHLLYADGYTIRGVQRILREQGVRTVQAVGQGLLTIAKPAQEEDGGPERAVADPELPLSPSRQAAPDRQGSEPVHREPDDGGPNDGGPNDDAPNGDGPNDDAPDRRETASAASFIPQGNDAAAMAGNEAGAATIDAAPRLAPERRDSALLDVERLRAALAELEACRRLLDGAMTDG